MSRLVPRDKPLSDEDRAYLLMLGKDSTVAYIDQQFPPESEDLDDEDEDLEDADEDEDLEDAEDAEDAEDDDTDDEDEDDDEEPDYDSWTVTDLKTELSNRQDANGIPLPTTGLKPELIARLREHDAQQ